MSIREVNDQYKEYADAYEPVKGKKSHGGLALGSALRMKKAAKGAAASIMTLAIMSTIVLNVFFHLSAQITAQSATSHEVTVSFSVKTSDFEDAGVYYVLTAPDGTVIATGPVNLEENTLSFTDLEENKDVWLSAPIYRGVEALADSSVVLRFIVYCTEENIFAARRRLNAELKNLFDEKGISIPFPQVDVHHIDKAF